MFQVVFVKNGTRPAPFLQVEFAPTAFLLIFLFFLVIPVTAQGNNCEAEMAALRRQHNDQTLHTVKEFTAALREKNTIIMNKESNLQESKELLAAREKDLQQCRDAGRKMALSARPTKKLAYVQVTNLWLNVRTKPGGKAAIISQVHQGDIVAVLEEEKGWLHVVLDDQRNGWIDGNTTKTVADTSMARCFPGQQIGVQASTLYSGPGFDYQKQDKITKQEDISINYCTDNWIQVEVQDKSGWLHHSQIIDSQNVSEETQ